MRVLHVELPEKMASELGALVEGGWFTDETEIVRLGNKGSQRRAGTDIRMIRD